VLQLKLVKEKIQLLKNLELLKTVSYIVLIIVTVNAVKIPIVRSFINVPNLLAVTKITY
jgi:hypothetical protein